MTAGRRARRLLYLRGGILHHWREGEVRRLAREAQNNGAEFIVTTEKDAVKMKAEWCQPLPLYSLRIELSLENEQGFWREVLKM